MVVKHLADIDLEALRAERHRLSDECARLVWLRRLVTARRDLEVARLTGAGAGLWGADGIPPAVRLALADEAGRRCPELLSALSDSVRTLAGAVDSAQRDLDVATDELVRRYHERPHLCLTAASRPLLVDTAR